jgi:hypothetical protein
LHCSGDIYVGVPKTTPGRVSRHVGILDQHDVGRLEIAMHDAAGVRCREDRRQLMRDAHRIDHLQAPAARFEPLRQRLALQKLHHQIGSAVGQHIAVEDLHEPGMLDAIHGAGLVEEARHRLFVARVLLKQDLDGDTTADLLVRGLIDRAHAPLADLLGYPVRPNEGADSRLHYA